MTTQLGNYAIEARIGEGGFGTVYGAMQICLGRRVAIKTLRDEYSGDPRQVESFQKQAALAASLEHPNIVRVYDCGCDNGTNYVVMQFIEGQTLESLLLRKGSLTGFDAACAARQIADALSYVHKQGVVHGDLNPGNIMFADDGRVYITDFGAASPSGSNERVVGVPEYVSPEQARGGEALPASDVYSLGVLMYHMLCGHPPFSEADPRDTLNAHISAKVPSMEKSARKAHPSLRKLVMRLLAKNPEDRPSAEAVHSALCATTSYLRPEPVKLSTKANQAAGLGRKLAAALIAPVVLGCLATGAMIYHSLRTENAIDSLVKEKSAVTKSIAETERKKRIRAEYAQEFTQGKGFYEKGQYGLAEAAFKRASHLQPKSTDPRMFLSAIYINREEYDKAAWHLRRIIRMDPDKREAHNALRFVEARLGASPVELSRP